MNMLTATLTRSEKVKAWLMENEEALLVFEHAFVGELRKKVDIHMVDKLESRGQFRYSYDGKTGKVKECHILLGSSMLEKENGVDQAIARIITIAHEFGHFVDLMEYYDGNAIEYSNDEEIIHEQDAWEIAVSLLDACGFDQFGYVGWRSVRNMIRLCLGSYYYDRTQDVKAAKEEAKQFGNLLLQFKQEQFAKEREDFMAL